MKTPDHYTSAKTPIERLPEAYREGFIIGNIIKYASRAGLKDSFEQDLEKCLHYCQMLMELRADKVEPAASKPAHPEPKGEVPPLPEGLTIPDGAYQLGMRDKLNEKTDFYFSMTFKRWVKVESIHGFLLSQTKSAIAYRKP